MDRKNVLIFGVAIVILSLVCIAPVCNAAVAPGDLDTTFGTNGMVTTDFSGTGSEDGAYALAMDSQGRIVVAGYTSNCGDYYCFALARYNTDGSLDSTFGTNGKVTTDFGELSNGGKAIAIDGQDRIVVAGSSDGDFALARYNTDGSLDATFGTNGIVITDFDSSSYAQALAIDSSDRIVAAGNIVLNVSSNFALARYNTDGSLDTTFDTDGKVTTDFGGDDYAQALSIDSQGRIVVAGSFQPTPGSAPSDFALARYNTDGSIDTTFGTNGKVTTDFGGHNDHGEALAIDSQGRIVVGGDSFYESDRFYSDFALARYNTDGSLDATFGTNGKVATDVFGGGESANALAIDSSGRIVVAGSTAVFALARYNPDGSLDTTFGTNGGVMTDLGVSTVFAIAIDSYEKIVAAGYSNATGDCCDYDFALARYLAGDPNPPKGTIQINGGAEATKKTEVKLTLTASDDTPGKIKMCISNKATCTTWTAFAETKSWTLTTGNGTKTVNVWFRDVWGNVNDTPYSDTIILDTIRPTNGTVTANLGDTRVTLDWSGFVDTLSGVGKYKVVFGVGPVPISCSDGKVIYSGTDTSYIHDGLTNGTKYGYRVCAVDKAGNVSTGATARAKPIPETDPPTGSITIKGGAESTKSTAVTLALTASDVSPGAIRMCISNKATCTTWTAFAATKNWTLTTGNGTKTVNVWFKDVWGNANATPYPDTIILDTIPPTDGTVTATPGDAHVTLDWTGFTDTGSGIESYKVVFSKGSAPTSCAAGEPIYQGADTTYTHTDLTNGTFYYYRVCAIDEAGNKSTGRTVKAKPE